MKFRADINALRAVAVLSVALYHFKMPFFNGGFVGVDIFFVISGYLMTKIISTKLLVEGFRLSGFYTDRAFRILPALIFVVMVMLVWGWFFLYPLEYEQLAKESVSAVLFLSNMLFHSQNGYFDVSSENTFLLHTWSLSVEWQFYILYPIVLMLVSKLVGVGNIKWFVLLLFALSIYYMLYISSHEINDGFYLLVTRAWEMLAGGLIVLFPLKNALNNAVKSKLQSVAVLLIILSVLYIDTEMNWPSFWTILPVFATVLFLQADFQNTRFINNSLVSLLGATSYSIYLWHWPVFIFMNMYGLLDTIIMKILGLMVSIGLGYLSYEIIEKMFINLKNKNKHNKRKLVSISMSLFLFSLPAWAVYKLDGVELNVRGINKDERSMFLTHYDEIHKHKLEQAYLYKCDFYDQKTNKAKDKIDKSCTNNQLVVKGSENTMFVWGDSHAQAIAYGLREVFTEYSFNQVATSGCSPSLMSKQMSSLNNNCSNSNQFALSEIERLKPEYVFIAQRHYHEKTDWIVLKDHLISLGAKKVLLLGPVPQFKPSLPSVYVRYGWDENKTKLSRGLDQQIVKTSSLLDENYAAKESNFTYISLFKELCNISGCQVVTSDRNLMLVDYGHLSPAGSVYVANIIHSKLIENSVFK